ncbi:MAG: hypothetical protein MJ233_00805 [Mycoplasmoidaceae bacterium]|nr:hypothetical protein [Mycoplasmoidaceae bacterium]
MKNQVTKTKDRKAKLSTVGYILGIVAIATSLILAGGVVGIPGIVFSAIGMKSSNQEAASKAKIGLILSIIGVAIAMILGFVGGYFLLKFIFENGGHPIG